MIRRHTERGRLCGKLREVKETIGRMMHQPIKDQGAYLKRVVNGFLNHFAVPTNSRAINSFYRHVGWYWFRALRRRSQIRRLTWARMKRLTNLWPPPARIRHPLPDVRFALSTQVGARCGSPARRILCGGRRAIVVPTATLEQGSAQTDNVSDQQLAAEIGVRGLPATPAVVAKANEALRRAIERVSAVQIIRFQGGAGRVRTAVSAADVDPPPRRDRHGRRGGSGSGRPSPQADVARHTPRAERRDRVDARGPGMAGRKGGRCFAPVPSSEGRAERGAHAGRAPHAMTSPGQIP